MCIYLLNEETFSCPRCFSRIYSARKGSQLTDSNNIFGLSRPLSYLKHLLRFLDDRDVFTLNTVSRCSSSLVLQVDVNSLYLCYKMRNLCP